MELGSFPQSHFFFNFHIDGILKAILKEVCVGGVVLLPREDRFHLEYTDIVALLYDYTQAIKIAPDQLPISIHRYGIHFVPFKPEVLHNWKKSLPALTLCDEPLEVIEKSVYLIVV